ncbi:hypothetical protein [Flavobacterium sp.]|uniref:hypothetical protein n=1 Tax=Flavobacterium sp. TaxID=239 RepID=UPI00260B6D1A|nr:hypothetical protein [Flavobacterium sp.]
MKKNSLLTLCLFLIMSHFNANSQVGIGTTTPRGAFEINSSTNGFVPPQVALTSIAASTPVINPQGGGVPIAGTIVYNTATAGTTPNNVTPGYYFWNGSVWIKFAAGDTSADIEDDLRVTIDKGSNSAQLGSLTGISGPEIWFFRDGQGVEAMSFTLQLPHNWKDGTTIYPHIHWVPRSSASGNMKWNLDYSWVNIDGTFSAATTSSVIVNGPFTANKHLLTDLTSGNVGIDATGKTFSSILICRIWRDSSSGTDTYSGDAGGLSMDFHISIKNPFVEYP